MAETPAGSAGGVGKSSTGMDANLAALLSYILGLLTGILFFVIEKDSKFVKFHAMQSILMSAALFVIGFVVLFIPIIGLFMPLVSLAIGIICMVQAYQGKWFKLPVIGDVAAKQVGGI